VTFAVKEGQK
jgi:hypothetical protein